MRTPQVSVDVRAWDRYPLRVAGVLEVADERGCGVNTAPMHPFFAPGAPEFAISIRQPWAWFILNLGKDVENRTWRTLFRGHVWIHASKGMTRDEYDEACQLARRIRGYGVMLPRCDDLPRGGIIGQVEITGCVTSSASKWFGGPHGFTLANPIACEFLPCKGSLGFFKPRI